MSIVQWQIGQEVDVAPRTWPGINKPGGVGKIINIHFSSLGIVDSLDVKYILGNNTDTNLEPDLVKPHVQLDRGRRSRKGRNFLNPAEVDAAKQTTTKTPNEDEKENQVPSNKNDKAQPSKKLPQKKRKDPKSSSDGPKKKKKTKVIVSKEIDDSKPKKRTNSPNRKKSADKQPTERAMPGAIPEFIVTKKVAPFHTVSPLEPCARMEGVSRSRVEHRPQVSEDSCAKSAPPKQQTKEKPIKSLSLVGPLDLQQPEFERKPLRNVYDNHVQDASNAKSAPPKQQTKKKPIKSLPPVDPLDLQQPGFERKTLRNIYDDQVQDASNYVNNLVGGSRKAEAANKKQEYIPLQEKTTEQRLDEERFQQFGKHFSMAMSRKDSMIPEDDLIASINSSISTDSKGCKPFASDEVERYVSRLCAEEKVMKSDGNYYAF